MDYQKITDYRNEQSSFSQQLEIVAEVTGLGTATAVKTIRRQDTNPLGVAHGAAVFAVADTACGTAAASYGYKAVTLDASYSFLRSAMVGDVVTATATEVKHGRTISVYDCVVTDQHGRKVGNATMTFYCLGEKLEL